jgi:hypothetical protein
MLKPSYGRLGHGQAGHAAAVPENEHHARTGSGSIREEVGCDGVDAFVKIKKESWLDS